MDSHGVSCLTHSANSHRHPVAAQMLRAEVQTPCSKREIRRLSSRHWMKCPAGKHAWKRPCASEPWWQVTTKCWWSPATKSCTSNTCPEHHVPAQALRNILAFPAISTRSVAGVGQKHFLRIIKDSWVYIKVHLSLPPCTVFKSLSRMVLSN